MNFKSSVAAVALAIAAIPSFAATYTATTSPVTDETNGYTFTNVAVEAGQKTFSDTFYFNLKDSIALDSSASFTAYITKKAATTFNLTATSISLYSVATGSLVETSSGFAATFTNLAAGSYYIVLSGTVSGTKGGTYDFNVTPTLAPVPEPETYALMLAGLGAVAFVARRRKSV